MKSTIKTPINVLIPDGDDHTSLVLQVLNCLSLEKEIDVFVMTSNKHNYLKYSRNVKRLLFYPKTDTAGWIQNINSAVEKSQIDVILPVFELGIRKLIVHQAQLKHIDKLCPLPGLKEFEIAIEKGALYLHLKRNGIACPKSVIVKSKSIPEDLNFDFPVIVKPVTGFGGGQQIKVLIDKDAVNAYCETRTYACDTIIQEYIEGYDISCNVLCLDGKIETYNMQRGSVYLREESSPQIGFDFFDEPEVYKLLSKLMKSMQWSGVANVDVRFDRLDNTYKVIEINPRFWINTDASAIAGINFPYLCCLLTLNAIIPNDKGLRIPYFNLKGLTRQVVKQPRLLFNFRFLKRNTSLGFALKDPLPMIYKFFWRTKNVIVSKIEKSTS